MRYWNSYGRRATACVLVFTITFATVPPVAARDDILGAVVVSGTAFAATPKTDWVKITAKTRPLVSGDRLRTGKDASLMADFQKSGVIGLYENSEISVAEQGADIGVVARAGKVAFHLAPASRVKLTAGKATIAAGARKAEGYVQFNAVGMPELVVESDDVNVIVAGAPAKVFVRGDRVVLSDALAQAPARAADERKAGAVAPAAEKSRSKKVSGISPLGWTAIGALVAAGVGLGVGLGAGGGGGGGDDENGSGE